MNLYQEEIDYGSTLWKTQIAYHKATNKYEDW